jgi:hypothetical protein
MDAIDTILQEAAAQGQSFFVAAGDAGATDCFVAEEDENKAITVDYPGSDPFAIDVGGTRLAEPTTPPLQYIWSDSVEGGAGGGGVSAHFAMPAYQAQADPSLRTVNAESSGATCNAASGYCREVPDVAAAGDPESAYIVYAEKEWQIIGGTSAAAPVWAAFTALANASPACGGKTIGFANPALYAIGGTAYDTNFYDITSAHPGGLRSNDLFDDSLPFFPGLHYDMATGIGSPVGTTLGASLCALANPPAPPTPPSPPTPAPTPSTSSDQGAVTNQATTTRAPAAHLTRSRLRGIAKGAPKLRLGLEARSGARLEAMKIALPRGLATAKSRKKLLAGIIVTAGGKRIKVSARTIGRSIQITLPTPVPALMLRIGPPALTVTPKLRQLVKAGKTKRLGLRVTTRESGGQRTRLPLTLPL